VTIIPANYVDKHRIEHTETKLLAANGTRIPLLGSTTVNAFIGRTPIRISGLVSEHVSEVMLGFDWLQTQQAQWNFIEHSIVINGQEFKLCEKRSDRSWCRRVTIDTDVVIPPESQLDVSTKTVFNSVHTRKESQCTTWSTEPVEVKEGLLVASTILPNRVTKVPVRLMNTTSHPIKLVRGTVVTELNPVEPLEGAAPICDKRVQVTDESVVDEVMSTIPEDTRKKLRGILTKYSSVFSKAEWDLGWTDLVTHRIDTGDHRPIRQQLRRYPPLHLQAIDEHLQGMLEQDVKEPASSPWASNIVLTKKKDGTLRCCIDYRRINVITRKDAYPLPKTDQCLDALSSSSWYSTFDLRSGFYQVNLAPEDRDKTAFVTRRGMFRYKTMPFG